MNPELFLLIAYLGVFASIGIYLRRLLVRSRDLEMKVQPPAEPEGSSNRKNRP